MTCVPECSRSPRSQDILCPAQLQLAVRPAMAATDFQQQTPAGAFTRDKLAALWEGSRKAEAFSEKDSLHVPAGGFRAKNLHQCHDSLAAGHFAQDPVPLVVTSSGGRGCARISRSTFSHVRPASTPSGHEEHQLDCYNHFPHLKDPGRP